MEETKLSLNALVGKQNLWGTAFFFSPDFFDGDLFTAVDLSASQTGRHGSGKVAGRFINAFNGKSTLIYEPSSTVINLWRPNYLNAIVCSEKPLICLDESGDTHELTVPKTITKIPRVDAEIKFAIYTNVSTNQEIALYCG